MTDSITLDGRKFRGVSQSITSNQNDYVQAYLREGGAMEVMSDLDGVHRTEEKRAEDLLTVILKSGLKPFILAGLLTEEGKPWSREQANANAARFGAITDFTEQKAMTDSIISFVVGFFQYGGRSSATSRRSSSRRGRVPPTENAVPATGETSPR